MSETTKLKKTTLWIIGCCVILVFLLSVLVLLSDKFINQEAIINRIQTEASQAINGRVELQRLTLSFFPQPHITIHQSNFSIPETASGTLASLAIYPKILPLFIGKVQIARIDVNTPDIEIRLHKQSEPKDEDLKSLALETVEEKIGAALSLMSTKALGALFLVENGRLNFRTGAKTGFKLMDINARIDLLADTVNFDIQCKSGPWKSIFLQGSMHVDADKSSFILAELKLDPPGLSFSGKLEINHLLKSPTPSIDLELKGIDVDISSARKVALSLAGEIPVVQKIFDIVKGGQLPLITFAAHGNSLEDLGKLENIIIKGRMLDGEIFVPEVDLDLKKVKGDVTISKGILQGHNLEARWGNSRASQGTLKLGLKEEDAPFHLDMAIEADLAQLPPLLKRLIDNEAFQKEAALIEDAKGSATGKLVLGESLADINISVEISRFDLWANYKHIPYPLQLHGRDYSFQGTKAVVKDLSGSLGRSSFSGLSMQLNWDKAPYLEVKSGKMGIILEEIYPWLASFEALNSNLKNIESVKGAAEFSALKVKGPLLEPENWHFQSTGAVKNLKIKTRLYSETLEVISGSFKTTEKDIAITDLQAKLADSSLQTSGTVSGYLQGVQNLDLRFQGEIGQNAIERISKHLNLPPELDIRSPVSISAMHLTWNNRRETTLSGHLALPQGLKVSGDIFLSPAEFIIKKLVIQDPESHVSFKLALANRELDLSFSGNLNKATMDHLMLENKMLGGWIKGDFHTHLQLDQPASATVQGELKVKNFIVPWKMKAPLVVNNLSLKTNKNYIRVESADLSWADNRFDLQGKVYFSPKTFLLDMEVSADEINLDNLKQTLDQSGKNNNQTGTSARPSLVRGALKLKTEKLTYKGFTWSPFYADIALKDGTASIFITKANLCGIATPGTLQISPQEITIDIKPFARDQELHSSLSCLVDKSVKIDGNFNFKADITAAQKPDETLLGSLEGSLEFDAGKGRFHSGRLHGTLIKILSLLNITEMFKGKLPDIKQEGFGYNSVKIKADIQNGKLYLNEAVIDSTAMEIAGHGSIDLTNKEVDAVVLVAPLKPVDFVVKKIPLVSTILGGNFITIPFKIKGPLDNLNVTPLAPSEVGKGLLGIIKRTLHLPVDLIQLILPDDKKNPG
ncbi:MAG: AsmA-like C-terminal domain-containing protein [Candidatus Desulfatibia sp.]|uniref:YhdP family protein n=1 Tax=Candidatus Desulfatibia sp. TaxID=3101189 RepID=UPI002F3498DD